MFRRPSSTTSKSLPRLRAGVVLLGLVAAGLGACSETYLHGYVPPDNAVEQVQTGASREQVLLTLGSPSTTATIGGEAFYYITQKTDRPVAFLEQRTVEQKVLVVYFDDKGKVKEIGNYGLQDGKVFDFIGRKTKTTGADIGLLTQMLKASPANPLAGN